MEEIISLPVSPEQRVFMDDLIMRHAITGTTFDELVFNFFNELPANIVPHEKSDEAVIDTLENSLIVDKVYVTISPDLTNEDLEFFPELRERSLDGKRVQAIQMASYSAGLLVGLATAEPGCTFNFYKAAKNSGGSNMKTIVVFSVSVDGEVKHFMDLSEAHP